MKGSETKLTAFLQGATKRFVIPVYQRNYDWKTENCKQLYDDLVKVVQNERKSHFFGSIVSVYNSDGNDDEFQVIDGQQRLTTVSLLLLAIHNLIEEKVIIPGKASLSSRIFNEYLVDSYQDDDNRIIKLKPVKNDRIAYEKLFDDALEYVPDSNLTINYTYFYKRIQKEEVTVDALFDAINKLEIISIRLNQDDNPQLIFESLNSTGVALSEGDKIRNFILMGLPTKEQNTYYEKYWNKIEICTGYDVSAFIRDYLSVKQQMIPAQKKVYFTFKAYVEDHELETEPLLSELLSYAKWYQILLNGGTNDRELNACIYRLNRLETTVTRPFFLEVFRMQSEGRLQISEVTEIFLIAENYLFRRSICDLPTNVLNKVFLALHREIMRYDETDDLYVEKFKYALVSKRDRARFPEDAEFAAAFAQRQIYLMNTKTKIYVLERLENFGTREDKDVYRHFDDGNYSIEHIMPQHLTPVWVRDLGEDYEEIHETWLHRIANLTLTAYNSKYSNSPFEVKKNREDGFIQSGIRMNTYIARKDRWGRAELEERSAYLTDQAMKIWALPDSAFMPEEKQMDSYTLDDDVSLSGRVIARFSYKNTEQPVTSWIDMYERVLKILHEEDKSVLSHLAHANAEESDLTYHFRSNPSDLRVALEIDTGIYAERNTSTWLKMSVLRKLFKLYDVDPVDLTFYLRDADEEDQGDEAGSRYELRRKYWTFALPYIKKANEDSGTFSKVNPSKENWISGFFGIGGFNISCVANFDSARVDFCLGKTNKDENKKAYDILYANKTEIEHRAGAKLLWYRGDEIKSSKVSYEMRGVSINQETDWLQMAKFHAEWSRKFYDILVPYLMQ